MLSAFLIAAAVAVSPQAASSDAAKSKPKKVCMNVAQLQSRISRRICMTEEEAALRRKEAEERPDSLKPPSQLGGRLGSGQ